MHVAELDINDPTQLEALFAQQLAVHRTDCPDNPPPLREPFMAFLRQVNPEARIDRLVATVDGGLVGAALVGLSDIDNRHLAVIEVSVDPAHRRRGVGRALLDRASRRAGEEQRRTLVAPAVSAVPGGPPRSDAGGRFLKATGFSPALAIIRRRVDLNTVDDEAEQRLLDECLPYAANYECVTWTGPTPDPLATGVADLVNRLSTDAPRGDLDIEATTMDPKRLHADERNTLDQGTHLVGAAAVHRGTGSVAAITRIDVRSIGDHGEVWLTIAHPDHRGHRLGTVVKIEAHRRVRREFPGLRYVRTGNADVNAHMVAINERLGYVPYEAATNYQRTL